MSEFECRNRHLMNSGDRTCHECGEPLAYMDGMSGAQLAKMEADEARGDELVDNDGNEYDLRDGE